MKAPTVGTSVDPSTTRSAPLAATWSAGPLYAATSEGKTFAYTVLMPSFCSSVLASWTGGSAKGSWAIGKAAVFGRWPAGSDPIHLTNGSISSAIGGLTSNPLWSAWLDGGSQAYG